MFWNDSKYGFKRSNYDLKHASIQYLKFYNVKSTVRKFGIVFQK